MKITAKRGTSKSVISAADFDAQSFKERRVKARDNRLKAANEKVHDVIEAMLNAGDTEDKLQVAFEALVPPSGKADTVAGELVRAMMKIMYRDFNDGDLFYEGYGIETCGEAVAYLCDQMPKLESEFEGIAMRNLEGNQYTEGLVEIAEAVVSNIIDYPELISEKNDTDMYSYDGERFIKDQGWEPEYEFECDIPDTLYNHIEAGNISTADVEYEIENWGGLDGAGVRVEPSWVHVYGISKDTLDELEYDMESWLEQWGLNLNDEFGDPSEEDYEDEEDDYEEE